jgi:Glycosyltransferase sugar-binding region containing DXD motif
VDNPHLNFPRRCYVLSNGSCADAVGCSFEEDMAAPALGSAKFACDKTKVPHPPISSIPNIVHWVFPGFDGEPWPFWALIHAAAVVEVLRPSAFYFHHVEGHLPAGPWWDATKSMIILSPQPRVTSVYSNNVTLLAHQSDVMRLGALLLHGGIYLDTDVLVLRSFAPLLSNPFVIGVQSPGRTANALMLASRESEFIRYWADSYHDFVDSDWDAHSVRLPWRLAEEHPDLLVQLPKSAWFSPGPDDDPGYELFRRRMSDVAFEALPKSYAHHLWNTITAAELVEVSAPSWLCVHPNTLYARLVRQLAQTSQTLAGFLSAC